MKFYELICRDLSNVGGPMGSETTSEIFRKAFTSVDKAKLHAEKDNKKRNDTASKCLWKRNSNGSWYSGDLLRHDYSIHVRTIKGE